MSLYSELHKLNKIATELGDKPEGLPNFLNEIKIPKYTGVEVYNKTILSYAKV